MVFVLIAENVGHVKTVALMTGKELDDVNGRALMADGAATVIAGFGGGSGTTTYAENIGVMASSRVYSTAAYWIAGMVAIALAFLPKFGVLINTIPAGVAGGAGIVLYGMIAHRRRPALGAEQGRLLQPDQPDDRRHRPDHRDRALRHQRALHRHHVTSAASRWAPRPPWWSST